MNEDQYNEVCKACDHVLLSQGAKIERVAISWLHVIREHPVFLENYKNVFIQNGNRFYNGKRVFRYIGGWIKHLITSARLKSQYWYESKPLPENVDVLFISHFVNETHAGLDSDFYFGDMPNIVDSHGDSAVIALLNHTSIVDIDICVKKWSVFNVPRVVFLSSLSLFDEINIWFRLLKESFNLYKEHKNEKKNILKKVFLTASIEALSSGARSSLRIEKQINKLVSKLKPKTIMVVYEGHAWERMAFSSVRRVNPKIKCIGYQHAVVFRLQHAIRRNLTHKYNPDSILTSGIIAKNQFEMSSGLKGMPVKLLGSNKSYDTVEVKSGEPVFKTCLVIPEGLPFECNLLFNFSLDCAIENPEINFIFRLHPVISFHSLVEINPKISNLPDNVVISKNTFHEDINESQFALYRGSTAIIEAALRNVRPIYLDCNESMTIDPLYEISDEIHKVKTSEDFKKAITFYQMQNAEQALKQKDTVNKYCNNIFNSLDSNILLKELDLC